MKNTFSTLAECQEKLTESQIVAIVNRYLEQRAKQRQYHKAYNQTKKLAVAKYNELKAIADERGVDIEDVIADLQAA